MITQNVGRSTVNLKPASLTHISLSGPDGKVISTLFGRCPEGGSGVSPTITARPFSVTLEPGSEREGGHIDLSCYTAAPGTYSVSVTEMFAEADAPDYSRPIAILRSNTLWFNIPAP